MHAKIVATKNIARLTTAQRSLTSRTPGAPGMGAVTGNAGLGKSSAIAWLSNKVPAIYVRATALMTPSSMLGAMCKELRLAPGGSCAAQVDRVVERLAVTGQTVFLDEVDYICKSTRLIETLRDLHDLSTVPVVLIGEERLLQKLSHLPRLTSRIAQEVAFAPLDIEDLTLVARELCEVEVKPDLLERIHRETKGNMRLAVVSLARIEQHAKTQAARVVSLADWGAKRDLFSGEAATPLQAAR